MYESPYFSLANLLNDLTRTSIAQSKADTENKLLTEFELPSKTIKMNQEMKQYIRDETPMDIRDTVTKLMPDAHPGEIDYIAGKTVASGLAMPEDPTKIRYKDVQTAYKLFNNENEIRNRYAFAGGLINKEIETLKADTSPEAQTRLTELQGSLDKLGNRFATELGDKALIKADVARTNPITGKTTPGQVTSMAEIADRASGGDPVKAMENYKEMLRAGKQHFGGSSGNKTADTPAALKAASATFLGNKAQYLFSNEELSEGKNINENTIKARLGKYIPGFTLTFGDLQKVEDSYVRNKLGKVTKVSEETYGKVLDEAATHGQAWLTQGGAAQHSSRVQRDLIDAAKSGIVAGGWRDRRGKERAVNSVMTKHSLPRDVVETLWNLPAVQKEIKGSVGGMGVSSSSGYQTRIR